MGEVWKPVPSLQGVMASSEGRIKLPPRTASMPNGGVRTYHPEPTSGLVKRSRPGAMHCYYGYYSREFGNIKVHQAVCEAFHGEPPFEGAVVMHLDENSLNNREDNLAWGTQRENLNAAGFRNACSERTKAREFEAGVGGFKRKAD